MFGLDNIIGGGLGLLSGATSSAGYKGKAFGQMTDADTRRDAFGRGLSRTEGWASGEQPLYSDATINQRISGQNARLDAAAGEARNNASERNIQNGMGPRNGGLENRMGEIDRSLLDAKRQQAAPLYAQLAMQEPEYKMRAQSMLFPVLSQQEQIALAEHQRIEELKAARAAQGSQLHRALAGAASGFVGAGMGGGGGAASGLTGNADMSWLGQSNYGIAPLGSGSMGGSGGYGGGWTGGNSGWGPSFAGSSNGVDFSNAFGGNGYSFGQG